MAINPEQVEAVAFLIHDNIIAFGLREAEISAELYHRAGRRRGSQPDCFIAATAICAGARLATQNKKHFAAFGPAGLRLA